MPDKRVLILYYSYTQQTRALLRQLTAGLASEGIGVTLEPLVPVAPYEFPFRSTFRLVRAMVATFFQRRMRILPVAEQCYGPWDAVVLAGPTWSYNPSGPMLDFLDRFGQGVCGGKQVVPLISCRAYWQLHFRILNKRLQGFGASVSPPVVFSHPVKEPWRSIGLLLKLRGLIARKRYQWLRRFYPQYGHDAMQLTEAFAQGQLLGQRLNRGASEQFSQ